jgi:sugar lactone lactonase YvrE
MPRWWYTLRVCACVLAYRRRALEDDSLSQKPELYEPTYRPEDDEALNPLLTRPSQPTQPRAAADVTREARELAALERKEQQEVLDPDVRDAFGQRGAQDERLSGPTHVIALPSQQLLVSDSNKHRLAIFSPDGQLLRTIGRQGAGTGSFDDPRGLSLDPDGKAVYVVECGNNRVQKIRIDDGASLGKSAYRFAKSTAPKQLKCPESIAIGSGVVFVVDVFHNRVVAFDLRLQFLFAFGEQGKGEGQFAFPKGLAVQGNELFVSDTFNRRIQVFTLDGVYVRQFGYEGEGLGAFSQPHGITAARDYLFVADFTGKCVHVFRPNGTAVQRRELPGRSTDVYGGPSASRAVYAVDNEHGEIHVMALKGAVEDVQAGDHSGISTKSEL